MPVAGIGSRHLSSAFVSFDAFFHNTDNAACIRIEAHLVENLKAKLLIGMDVMGHEGFRLDFDAKTIRIPSCMGIEIPIAIHSNPQHAVQRAVYAAEHTVIPPRSVVCVPARVQSALPEDRGYVFEGRHRQAAFYSHLVEANFSRVQAVNDTGNPVTLRRRDRIGTLYEADMPMACAVESVQANREDADECAKYAAMVMKKQYDTRHKPVFFEKGDYVCLRLAQGAEPGYVLPSRNITRKLTQRHIGCVG